VSRVLISIKQQVCSCFHLLQHGFLHWTRPLNTSLLLGTLADLTRGKSELVAENALLRQQLIILRRQSKRPVCTKRDRSLLVLLARAPPIKPPMIPMTIFPRIPNLSPWINRSASAPAKPPTTIQTIHAQSVPRTLAMTTARIILLLLLLICIPLGASRGFFDVD